MRSSSTFRVGLKKSGLISFEEVIKEKVTRLQQESLDFLNLDKLCIEDRHISLLNQTLGCSKNLKRLSLRDNFISNQGVKELLADLCPRVEELDLSNNMINSSALKDFLQAIKQPRLKLAIIRLAGANIKKTNQSKAQKLFAQYKVQILFE